MTTRFGQALLVMALCSACGGEATTSPMAPTAPVSAYQGAWTGQTSQSQPFGFVVTGNQLTRVNFNVSYTGISCSGGLSLGADVRFVSIANAEFSATSTILPGDMTWSVAGTFVSATMATGTLQVSLSHAYPSGPRSACSPAIVHVTWTAQKSS